jgi:hypothetical protein
MYLFWTMVMYVTGVRDELGYDILCVYYCFFEIMILYLYFCLDVATSQQRVFVSTKNSYNGLQIYGKWSTEQLLLVQTK